MTRRTRITLEGPGRDALHWWYSEVDAEPQAGDDAAWEAQFARWEHAESQFGADVSNRLYRHLQQQGLFVCRREHDPREFLGGEVAVSPAYSTAHSTEVIEPDDELDLLAYPLEANPRQSSDRMSELAADLRVDLGLALAGPRGSGTGMQPGVGLAALAVAASVVVPPVVNAAKEPVIDLAAAEREQLVKSQHQRGTVLVWVGLLLLAAAIIALTFVL